MSWLPARQRARRERVKVILGGMAGAATFFVFVVLGFCL